VLFEPGQLFLDGLLEQRKSRGSDQGVFVLPALLIQQVILKTAKADTLLTEDVPRLQPATEEQIDQKFIAVEAQALLPSRLLSILTMSH